MAGCALLPLESPVIPHPSSRVVPAYAHGHQEAVGVIHIHTTESDGRLPIEAVARIANRQGLDFLIITDHDTLVAKQEGKEGWYGSTLVLVGAEISTSGGHYLGLRLKEEIPRLQEPQWVIDAVSRQGGLGFIAHPHYRRRPWQNPDAQGMTGLEIYNLKDDVLDEFIPWLGLSTLLFGSEGSLGWWLDRPADALALWDQMLVRGKPVVGIGSPDAHGLMRIGLRLGPYATLFKFVRNHLLIPGALTPEAAYQALAQGHLFVAHDLVADPTGFVFLAVRQGVAQGIMGDRVTFEGDLELYGYLPGPGEMVLLQDGRQVGLWQGQEVRYTVPHPGVYRLEASRKGTPWLYSNPIYVVE